MGKISGEAAPAVPGWRGRRGLALAIILPAAALASLSTVHLVAALSSAGAAGRVGALARLTVDSTRLAAALEAERSEVVRFAVLGSGPAGSAAGRGSASTWEPEYQLEQAVLKRAFLATDRSAGRAAATARAIGDSYPAAVREQAAGELAVPGRLAALRRAATTTDLPSLDIIRVHLGDRLRAARR